MASDPELIERLRVALRGGPSLQLAILFGSTARGTRHAQSDVDVAILPVDLALSLADESELQLALERARGTAVDLVRLDHAPLRSNARDSRRVAREPAAEAPGAALGRFSCLGPEHRTFATSSRHSAAYSRR